MQNKTAAPSQRRRFTSYSFFARPLDSLNRPISRDPSIRLLLSSNRSPPADTPASCLPAHDRQDQYPALVHPVNVETWHCFLSKGRVLIGGWSESRTAGPLTGRP